MSFIERQLLPTDGFREVTAYIVSDVGIKGAVFALRIGFLE